MDENYETLTIVTPKSAKSLLKMRNFIELFLIDI